MKIALIYWNQFYRQLHYIEQSIKNVLDDADNGSLSYVTENDIKKCFNDNQVLVLEVPLGGNLAVGSPSSKVTFLYLYVIYIFYTFQKACNW